MKPDQNELDMLIEIMEDVSTLPFDFDMPLKVDISLSCLSLTDYIKKLELESEYYDAED